MQRRTFKYYIRPNKTAERYLVDVLRTHARVYNEALAWRIHSYDVYGRAGSINVNDQAKFLGKQRKSDPWLGDCNALSLHLTLRRLDEAYKAFFRRCKKGGPAGFPKFKSADQFNTIHFAQNNGYKVFPPEDGKKWGRLRLTRLVDGKKTHHEIRVKFHRPLPDDCKQKQISISRDGNRWYLCISLEIPDATPTCGTGSVGVDLGLKKFATLSTGEALGVTNTLESQLPKLRVAQRAFDRKKNKRSNRRRRSRKRRAAIHRKIRNTRNDQHHKVAKELVDRYGMVAVENLNVEGMIKNPKLARRIADAGWSQFINTLTSKAEQRGGRVVAVPPHYTSQECSGCGELVPKSLSVRTHRCPHCGLVMDRDENAAKNILNRALEMEPDK